MAFGVWRLAWLASPTLHPSPPYSPYQLTAAFHCVVMSRCISSPPLPTHRPFTPQFSAALAAAAHSIPGFQGEWRTRARMHLAWAVGKLPCLLSCFVALLCFANRCLGVKGSVNCSLPPSKQAALPDPDLAMTSLAILFINASLGEYTRAPITDEKAPTPHAVRRSGRGRRLIPSVGPYKDICAR